MPPNFVEVVSIIESPSATDILDNRREGYALTSALSLSGIPTQYFAVSSRATLQQAFEIIASNPASTKRIRDQRLVQNNLYVPFIHISVHGDEDGIYLTDETFIAWDELRDLLMSLKHITIDPNINRKCLILCLSACRGIHAKKMIRDEEPWPFYVLVGSDVDVSWSDALTAWITFYHLSVTKFADPSVALERMNLVADATAKPFSSVR